MVENTQGESQPKIKRGRFDSLNLYEVTEEELQIIEAGSPISIYLSFAIFLISTAVSFLITLLTVKIESLRLFCIFVIICIVGFILGSILFLIWFRNRKDFKKIIAKIKSRLKTE